MNDDPPTDPMHYLTRAIRRIASREHTTTTADRDRVYADNLRLEQENAGLRRQLVERERTLLELNPRWMPETKGDKPVLTVVTP